MNSERTAQLQVALASYDLKELRVQKRYLQEQGTAIDCTCFCSGEKLLAQLRQGVRYDAVVLCSELTDLPAEQFVRQFYQLKERPMLSDTEPWPQQRHGVAKAPRGVLLRRGH